jgi:peptide methionine sulfoxide reductase msrA/msrB
MIHKRFFKCLLMGLCSTLLSNANGADNAPSDNMTSRQDAPIDYVVLGMGCFWGAEKRMSTIPGVVDVENGYANGEIEAGYREILDQEKALRMGRSTKKNYAEVVKVTFDTSKTDLRSVLVAFWQNHDPTQGNRQGNDIGSNYRSAIYTHNDTQKVIALKTRAVYQQALKQAGYGDITTEIAPLSNYHTAEAYHQDYLEKHPNGYCGLGGTGVNYPGSTLTLSRSKIKQPVLEGKALNHTRQLVVFEAEECPYCKQFKADILDHWDRDIAVERTMAPQPPTGWTLQAKLVATPTIVLFENGTEVSRYTGYNGNQLRFWRWLNAKTAQL